MELILDAFRKCLGKTPSPCDTSTTLEYDLVTVAALGIVAFISTDMAHEVVGHGIGLLIAGGRSGTFTTTRLIYSSQLAGPNWKIFDIGGPAGNLMGGALLSRTTIDSPSRSRAEAISAGQHVVQPVLGIQLPHQMWPHRSRRLGGS
jgi:hypothetical protein